MIKLTREMVSKMGTKITGIEEGKTCSIKTMNKVKKILLTIYNVMDKIYEMDKEENKYINKIIVTFGHKRIRLVLHDGEIKLTNETHFIDYKRYNSFNTNKFSYMVNQLANNLDTKEFLLNTMPIIYKECVKQNDFVLWTKEIKNELKDKEEDVNNELVDTKGEEEMDVENTKEPIIILITNTDRKVDLDLSDCNATIINEDCTAEVILNGEKHESDIIISEHDEVVSIGKELTDPNKNCVVIDYSGKDTKFRLEPGSNVKEFYVVKICKSLYCVTPLLGASFVYELDKELNKFRIIKSLTDNHPLLKDDDVITTHSSTTPQVILNEYLTNKAIKMFTEQAMDIISNYDIFNLDGLDFNFHHVYKHIYDHPSSKMNDFDIVKKDDICEIKHKKSNYKEIITKTPPYRWVAGEGTYYITEFIDENNPYMPVLKLYSNDDTINCAEFYMNGVMVKSILHQPNMKRVIVNTYGLLLNNEFDSCTEIYRYNDAFDNYMLIYKIYKKGECVYRIDIEHNLITMSDEEMKHKTCQNILIKEL